MRTRNVKGAKPIIDKCLFLIKEPQDYYFNNNNPLVLEIGMGKGQYLLNSALNNPNVNYIGVEKYDSIIARAINKITPHKLDNLLIIREDASNLEKYFSKQINTIVLNFSDPWPKKRHSERRLTSSSFLKIYDKLFIEDSHLILKTDNLVLFASSLIELNNYGYLFKEVCLDLFASEISNVLTEYEEKFIEKGLKINYLECYKKKK